MAIRIPDYISQIIPYKPGKPTEEVERELGLSHTIKLASNENPLGPSTLAVEAMHRAAQRVHRYPDGSGYYLRERLSDIHGVAEDQIMLGNGSTDLVEIFARTFLGPDGNAVMADQAFVMYRLAVMTVNGNARLAPLHDMRHDLNAMRKLIDDKTRIVFIANPNNPTGTYVTGDDLCRFVEDVPEDVLIVLDEAYREYVRQPDFPESISFLGQGRRVAILRTFSKIHGLAGVRIGYALTSPDVVEAAERVRSPFNTNRLGQSAALAALDDPGQIERSFAHNAAQLRFMEEALRERGIGYVPSVANFILIDTGLNADEIFAALLKEGVIVRPMGAYNLPTSLRVTIGTHEENVAFLAALERVLSSRKSINA